MVFVISRVFQRLLICPSRVLLIVKKHMLLKITNNFLISKIGYLIPPLHNYLINLFLFLYFLIQFKAKTSVEFEVKEYGKLFLTHLYLKESIYTVYLSDCHNQISIIGEWTISIFVSPFQCCQSFRLRCKLVRNTFYQKRNFFVQR